MLTSDEQKQVDALVAAISQYDADIRFAQQKRREAQYKLYDWVAARVPAGTVPEPALLDIPAFLRTPHARGCDCADCRDANNIRATARLAPHDDEDPHCNCWLCR